MEEDMNNNLEEQSKYAEEVRGIDNVYNYIMHLNANNITRRDIKLVGKIVDEVSKCCKEGKKTRLAVGISAIAANIVYGTLVATNTVSSDLFPALGFLNGVALYKQTSFLSKVSRTLRKYKLTFGQYNKLMNNGKMKELAAILDDHYNQLLNYKFSTLDNEPFPEFEYTEEKEQLRQIHKYGEWMNLRTENLKAKKLISGPIEVTFCYFEESPNKKKTNNDDDSSIEPGGEE